MTTGAPRVSVILPAYYSHAARNHGVGLAQATLLVFTDPDCEALPTWLQCLVLAHGRGHGVVGGSIEPGGRGWLESGIHLCKFSRVLCGLPEGPRCILPSANVAYDREVWDAAGPLDPTRFCSDALLSWKAAAVGHQPRFEPRAVVRHHHDETVADCWRERYGRGREFAVMRIEWEGWSRPHAAARMMLTPMLVCIVLARAGLHSLVSGWTARWIVTLPVQAVGPVAWCLGEAAGYWQRATSGALVGERNTA